MNYKKEEIKKGITLHTINTNKFKTNLFSIMLTTPLSKENVTKNALLSLILRRGTNKLKSQDEISKELENMYGADFDCGIDKMGDNHVIKFYLESLNDKYLPNSKKQKAKIVGVDDHIDPKNNFQESISLILDIVFNPLLENDVFKNEYLETEKIKLKQIIEGKKDSKGLYSFNRCIEEMYKNKPFGLYKFGNTDDLEKITNRELMEYYKELIQKCKIDIFVSGDIQEDLKEIILKNENILKLEERQPDYVKDSIDNSISSENNIEEKLDVTQGKLVIGMNICENNVECDDIDPQNSNIALVYNAILGGTANSKLFQNVREKASLAYTTASNYIRQKHNIFIRAGIEIENYEKALNIIKEQLEDMKKGKFDDNDVKVAKQYITSTIQGIPDEQDTEISYYFGQELSGTNNSIEEYMENINSVTKDQIIDLANSVKINTIYFLRN